ncbi:Acetoacetyl-CoA synthetase [Smittium culicis]|uniref:Acetoacetyl-CoA synthetase n=1 Tax=Smittium culicis TaxID=133412 RepID=A0A1R1XNX1_9FUNG|nr:Acetoacetyl-CoA synthetase [Smittium culicis]OMJ20328.1 Acetoacetyl-CoA synthetase [Smittium culicis]
MSSLAKRSNDTLQLPVWVPKNIEDQEISKFMRYASSRYNRQFDNYDQLLEWSITELEEFYSAVWDYWGVITHSPYTKVLDTSKKMNEIPTWFTGVSVNFAENIFARYKDLDKVAIYARGEQEHKNITFKQLYSLVSKAALALKKMGVKKGDRVVGFITNSAETIIAFLAAASIGAIWSSSPVDFGVTAVSDRFSQVQPKIYISIDESTYNGKKFSLIERNNQILKSIPSVEKIIIIQNNKSAGSISSLIPGSITWDSFIDMGKEATDLKYELLPFDYPIFIVFSSGTTGKPKCITHRTGGYIIQPIKEYKILAGMDETDTYFYFTTTGWIMWNSLPCALLVGASIVTYEGNPLGPKVGVLWDMAEEVGVTRFGTSPKYLQSLEDNGYYPKDHHDLSKLKCLTSTGSPLKSNNYDFVYNHIREDLFLVSMSGGTELGACFFGGIPILPVYRGEIQCQLLGMAVECWDSNGNKLVGEKGDLICTKPFPSMPIYFWGDTPDKARYMSSYFEKFPGVWYHGDYFYYNPETKGIIMLGRSDGTLNPNGVRFGSSEIYNIVEKFDDVLDSLVVGQQMENFERVILFILLKNQSTDVKQLESSINQTIRSNLSPRHVPSKIIIVDKIPYTANGKKVEIAVKSMLSSMYSLAQEFISNSGGSAPRNKVIEHVRSTFSLDERTIQSVSDPSAIFQFMNFSELMFTDLPKSKL